jgi:hypothetical protein
MLEVFGFLGFFEVDIIRQFPSSWEWQGQTSVDDEHEGANSFSASPPDISSQSRDLILSDSRAGDTR